MINKISITRKHSMKISLAKKMMQEGITAIKSNSDYSYNFLNLSVCLSSACLKSFDGFRCHLAETLVGSNVILLDGVPGPQRKGRFGSRTTPTKTSNSKLLLPPSEWNEELHRLATVIPSLTKLL